MHSHIDLLLFEKEIDFIEYGHEFFDVVIEKQIADIIYIDEDE
jgi:hypothetical protein